MKRLNKVNGLITGNRRRDLPRKVQGLLLSYLVGHVCCFCSLATATATATATAAATATATACLSALSCVFLSAWNKLRRAGRMFVELRGGWFFCWGFVKTS